MQHTNPVSTVAPDPRVEGYRANTLGLIAQAGHVRLTWWQQAIEQQLV